MFVLLGSSLFCTFNPIYIPLISNIIGAQLLFGMFIFAYFISKIPLLCDFFIFWGRNSLIMMVTHYSIILVLCEIANRYILKNESFSGSVTLYFFIFTVLIEYPIVYLMNKKCALILGRY